MRNVGNMAIASFNDASLYVNLVDNTCLSTLILSSELHTITTARAAIPVKRNQPCPEESQMSQPGHSDKRELAQIKARLDAPSTFGGGKDPQLMRDMRWLIDLVESQAKKIEQ